MSEPSHWRPPGSDVSGSEGSPPTVPLPLVRPGGARPPGMNPTARYPAPEPPTTQLPAPSYPGTRYVEEPDHGGTYGSYEYDDRHDDRYSRRYDDHEDRHPRSRGQLFAGVVLLLALIVSGLLAVPVYQILVSIDLVSADPFAGVAGWLMPLVGALVGAAVVFVLAVAAVAVARPKGLAGLALAASMLLPLVAVVLGIVYGGPVLRQNVENGIAAQGAAAAEQGAAAVDSAIQRFQDELALRGLDAGPVRDLVGWALSQGG